MRLCCGDGDGDGLSGGCIWECCDVLADGDGDVTDREGLFSQCAWSGLSSSTLIVLAYDVVNTILVGV